MNLVEIVPTDLDVLKQSSKDILSRYDNVQGINVPDILRQSIRSHDAVELLLDEGITAIPHIRTIDRPLTETIALVERLIEKGLKHVLLITGDAPTYIAKTYPVTPMMAVRSIKERWPFLKVYCALDPYRASFLKEIRYCEQKAAVGADGFFTQPFFDPELARIYIEQLKDFELFIGISPVITERSQNYWINKNHAIFPERFGLSVEKNAEIGKEILDVTRSHGKNTYIMPIRVPVQEYLDKLFLP